jgi:hypothetical protein
MADSKVIWSSTTPIADEFSHVYGPIQEISADGRTVMVSSATLASGTVRKPGSWRLAWLAYSVPAGTVRTLYQVTVTQRATGRRGSGHTLDVGKPGSYDHLKCAENPVFCPENDADRTKEREARPIRQRADALAGQSRPMRSMGERLRQAVHGQLAEVPRVDRVARLAALRGL